MFHLTLRMGYWPLPSGRGLLFSVLSYGIILAALILPSLFLAGCGENIHLYPILTLEILG
jgi:hypothetical protein